MTVDRLFIIGLDGLDISIARQNKMLLSNHVEWNLADFPKLHTLRIWPSMFVGELIHENPNLPNPLTDKGIYHSDETFARANWRSPALRYLSKFSHLLLPHALRSRIGSFLIESGYAKVDADKDDWPDTVFSGMLSNAINIPAYNPLPIQRELKSGWKTRISSAEDGLEQLSELADQEREEVAAELTASIERGYDLTWAYAFNPDIFGHVDYHYSYEAETVKTWEAVVEPVLEALDEDDELVVVTDHGMEEQDGAGDHRPPGWLATTMTDVELPESPQDVRWWIEGVVGERSKQKEETLRDLGYL